MSVFLEPTEGLHLEPLDEPVELRQSLRQARLDGVEGPDGLEGERGLIAFLWDQWRPVLEPAGIDRAAFVAIVVGYGRELGLWLMGERQWNEVVTGLAGRVSRRLPAG